MTHNNNSHEADLLIVNLLKIFGGLMLKPISSFLCILLTGLFLASCDNTPVSPIANSSQTFSLNKSPFVQSITGSGNFFYSENDLRVITFEAKRMSDGSVIGYFELNSHIFHPNTIVSGKITAFSVVGNVIYWGGFVTNSNYPELIGVGGYSAVIDNGQGKNSPPDQISLIILGTPSPIDQAAIDKYCYSPPPLGQFIIGPVYDINAGNIQIH